MTFLDKLLDGVEVEWKTLGDECVGYFTRGSGLQKKDFTEVGVGCIHYGQIYTYYGTYADATKTYVSEEFAKKARKAKHGDLVIATTSENDEDVCKAVAWLGSNDIAVSSDACFYTHQLNPKYVAYFFQTEEFQKQKRPFITGTKVRRVNANDLAKIIIPIPCPKDPEKSLQIQQKIVGILDKFTKLTAELTAELTSRIKQYEFYREKLLSFEEGEVEWKPLGEVTLSTQNIKWKNNNRSYHYIDLTSVSRENNSIIETITINSNNAPSRAQKIVLTNDVIFATTRPTQQRLCLITDKYSEQIASTGYCVLRANTETIMPKWIYFYLTSTNFKNYVEENQSGSAYPAVSDTKIKDCIIPIPPLEEQARIVSILDKFDTLTTSLKEGLPREIELRQKQYEYYRDMLLAFPKEN